MVTVLSQKKNLYDCENITLKDFDFRSKENGQKALYSNNNLLGIYQEERAKEIIIEIVNFINDKGQTNRVFEMPNEENEI
jgi:Zn-finger protein